MRGVVASERSLVASIAPTAAGPAGLARSTDAEDPGTDAGVGTGSGEASSDAS